MNIYQRTLYWLAFADGLALLALAFIAVPLKHFLDIPLGVQVLGPAHGALFLSLVLTIFAALVRGSLRPGIAGLLFIGALVPLGAFYADHRLKQAYPEM